MSQTFANTINSNPIYAKRAEQDEEGLNIKDNYAKKSEIPTKTSDLTNDSNFVNTTEMNTALEGKQDTISDLSSIRSGAEAGATALQPSDVATVATTGSYNDLEDKPVIPTKTSDLSNDSGFVTSSDMSTALAAKEDVANKAQTVDGTSSTEYPSSAAVSNFVNSSVATATAHFLGNFTLTDLSLTYPATNTQIATALDSHTWPAGITPTNNDYVYVEVQDPQTTGIDDEVRRFKFNGTAWAYEYTLNNSSFTTAEKAAIDSGITSTKVTNYDNHVADTNIHVTTSEKNTWNAKQDAIQDLQTIREGAANGATALQPSDVATVATTGSYNDLEDKPVIPAAQVQSDWNQSDSNAVDYIKNKPSIPAAQVQSDWAQTNSSAIDFIKNKPNMKGKIHFIKAVPDSDLPADEKAPYGFWIVDIEKPNAQATFGYDYATATELIARLNAGEIFALSTYRDAPSAEEDIFYMFRAQDQSALYDSPALRGWFVEMFAGDDPSRMFYTTIYTPYRDPEDQTHAALLGRMAILNFKSQQAPLSEFTFAQADDIPTATSDLQNDSGFITSSDLPTVDQTYDSTSANPQSGTAVADALSGLATVASTGSYNDLQDKPIIPSVPVQDVEYNGSSVVNAQGVAEIPAPSYPVTDVTLDGTSVVSQGVAALTSPTVDQTYNSSSANAQSGVAVAQAISGISMDEVPDVTSTDDGKVLTASYSGGQGSYSWQTAQGGGGGGTVDQTYDGTSTNAQSGIAIEGELSAHYLKGITVLTYGSSTWADYTAVSSKTGALFVKDGSKYAILTYPTSSSAEFMYIQNSNDGPWGRTKNAVLWKYVINSSGVWSKEQRPISFTPLQGSGISMTDNATNRTVMLNVDLPVYTDGSDSIVWFGSSGFEVKTSAFASKTLNKTFTSDKGGYLVYARSYTGSNRAIGNQYSTRFDDALIDQTATIGFTAGTPTSKTIDSTKAITWDGSGVTTLAVGSGLTIKLGLFSISPLTGSSNYSYALNAAPYKILDFGTVGTIASGTTSLTVTPTLYAPVAFNNITIEKGAKLATMFYTDIGNERYFFVNSHNPYGSSGVTLSIAYEKTANVAKVVEEVGTADTASTYKVWHRNLNASGAASWVEDPVNSFISTGSYGYSLSKTETLATAIADVDIPIPDQMPIGDMFCCLDVIVKLSGATEGQFGILNVDRKHKNYSDGTNHGRISDVSVGLVMVEGINGGGAKGYASLLVRADGTIGANGIVANEWSIAVTGGNIAHAAGDTMTVQYQVRWIQGKALSATETLGTLRARWNS